MCYDCITYLTITDMHDDGIAVPNDLLTEAHDHIDNCNG